MTEEVTPELRLERLRRLYDVVKLHADADGEPVKLNGEVRGWDMSTWDCVSAACAFGSYVLTPYGQEYFRRDVRGPLARWNSTGNTIRDANRHFGISLGEAVSIFEPGRYSQYNEDADIPPDVVLERIGELIEAYSEANDDDG